MKEIVSPFDHGAPGGRPSGVVGSAAFTAASAAPFCAVSAATRAATLSVVGGMGGAAMAQLPSKEKMSPAVPTTHTSLASAQANEAPSPGESG